MRILLTQRKLHDYAGTELVTVELARALKARGHEIAVYCPRIGALRSLLLSNGIKACEDTAEVPWRPDVIHAHHQLPALAALARFAGVPCVYMCHGQRPWVERPPHHPQIRIYAAVSGKLATHIATEFDLAGDRVRVVPNFVDTQRFASVRRPDTEKPARAVLFGQSTFSEAEIDALQRACDENGLALDKIGYAYGDIRHHPELYLPDYDVVFAIGRSALEAMACGCATIPLVPSLAGDLIVPETLSAWADLNFSPRYFSSGGRVSGEWLTDQLGRYDPDEVMRVTERVRSEFALGRIVEMLEGLYGEAIAAGPVEDTDNALARELNRLAAEVDGIWEAPPGERSELAPYLATLERQSVSLRETAKDLTDSVRGVRDLAFHLASTGTSTGTSAGTSNSGAMTEETSRTGQSGVGWMPAIEASGLFQRAWYLKQNPDVASAGVDPLVHYMSDGVLEGRWPAPFFDGAGYLEANPHLRGVALAPIEIVVREAARTAPNREAIGKAGPVGIRGSLRRLLDFATGMTRRAG